MVYVATFQPGFKSHEFHPKAAAGCERRARWGCGTRLEAAGTGACFEAMAGEWLDLFFDKEIWIA